MFNYIVTPKQTKHATVKIICGDEIGSGFFVDKHILLTARHVIVDNLDEGASIKVEFHDELGNLFRSDSAKLQADDELLDVALLQIDFELSNDYSLPICNVDIQDKTQWHIFGFQYAGSMVGELYEGTLYGINEEFLPFDLMLKCKEIKENIDYSGLSGAAVVADYKVVGVVLNQSNNKIGAISVTKLKTFLQNNGINIKKVRKVTDIPEDLYNDSKNSIPNENTQESLDNILDLFKGRYLLLKGYPGSGKSTFVTGYVPENASIKIIGKYFIRSKSGDDFFGLTMLPDRIIEWFEYTILKETTGGIPPKADTDISKRITLLESYFNNLNQKLESDSVHGVFIIDGLDEVVKDGKSIDDFLSILPSSLPTNITILLSCTSKEVLPIRFRSIIEPHHEVLLNPLDLKLCEGFIIRELEKDSIDISLPLARKVAEVSEGHPLYLHYLLATIKKESTCSLEDLINNIPKIGGDIKRYYENIWVTDLSKDIVKQIVLTTVSLLRQPIDKNKLCNMIETKFLYSFELTLSSLGYLLNDNNGFSIFHSSFSDFMKSKCSSIVENIHKNISGYCIANPNDYYATANIIFHFLNSNENETALAMCNQDWVDRCASIHVEPDLILDDISNIELMAIRKGFFAELIRIKLLRSRIRYRYNVIFAGNTSILAKSLIKIGKYKDAMKYIKRNGVVIVSLENAFSIMQELFELDEFEYAMSLHGAIDDLLKLRFDEDVKQGSISNATVVQMSINNTYYLNINSSEASYWNRRLNKVLHAIYASSEPDSPNADHARHLMEVHNSIYLAYNLFRLNKYMRISEIEERFKQELDGRYLSRLLSLYYHYEMFRRNSTLTINSSRFIDLIKDVEYLVSNYDIDKDEVNTAIHFLVEYSSKPDLVNKIITTLNTACPVVNIRQKNGVDLTESYFETYFNYWMCKGYNTSTQCPELYAHARNWEKYLESAVSLLGYLFGRSHYLIAQSEAHRIENYENTFDELLESLAFSLKERSEWDRSYYIPEDLIPKLYMQIMKFIILFMPSSINKTVEVFIKKTNNQFGLYTEGFRSSLYYIIDTLIDSPCDRLVIQKLLNILYEHIYACVLNRTERASELLYVVYLFGKLGNNDVANDVYKDFLDTSMGPEWYKEDQMSMLETIHQLKPNNKQLGAFLPKSVQILETASGEMTFQRYVKQAREDFVVSILNSGDFSRMLEYLKYQLYPSIKQIIKSVDNIEADKIIDGHGYSLGANRIVAARSMQQLAKHLYREAPFFCWGLCEIFIVNEDTERYFSGFIDTFINIIESLVSDMHLRSKVIERIPYLVQRVDKDLFKSFLLKLEGSLSPDEFLKLKEVLLSKGYIFDSGSKKAKELPDLGDKRVKRTFEFPGLGTFDDFDEVKIKLTKAKGFASVRDCSSAINNILDAFKMMHKEKANIWLVENLSGEVKQLFETLLTLVGSKEAFIKTMEAFIIDSYTDDWRLADKLVSLCKEFIDHDELMDLSDIFHTHLSLLVRPDSDAIKQFEWLEREVDTNYSEGLIELFVWLLEYPYMSVNSKVVNIILWLSEIYPELIINKLVCKALSEDYAQSTTLCAQILHEISLRDTRASEILYKTIVIHKEQLFKLRHFIIKDYFMKMLRETIRNGHADELGTREQLSCTIPKRIVSLGKVRLNFSKELSPIYNELLAFNELQILNDKCMKDLWECVKTMMGDCSIDEFIKADICVRRSFYDEECNLGRYHDLMKYALNCSISSRVDQSTYHDVYNILYPER